MAVIDSFAPLPRPENVDTSNPWASPMRIEAGVASIGERVKQQPSAA